MTAEIIIHKICFYFPFETNVDLYRTAIEVCEVDPDWSLAFVPENENNNEEGLTVVE